MMTTRPAAKMANATLVSEDSGRTVKKHNSAPSTEAIAKDHVIRYIRSKCSLMMLGPSWMP